MLELLSPFPQVRIIPVIVLHDINDAVPLATLLGETGFPIIEVTLRTPGALKCIEIIAKQCPDLIVGAGTVIYSSQFKSIQSAGAKFAVSPGFTQQLFNAAKEINMPYLPGIVTPSEALHAVQEKLTMVKFFPAEAMGGINVLRSLSEVFSSLSFCPTGGVTLANFSTYLQLPTVRCVGGTWLTPVKLLQEKNWPEIKKLTIQTLDILKNRN